MRNSSLIICLALLVYACAPPSPPPPPAQAVAPAPPPKDTLLRIKPVLSLAQMDSFLHLQGKPISVSLWQLINVDQFPDMPDTVGVLLGNLDQDAEKEIVIWFIGSKHIGGNAMCFDRQEDEWHYMGEEYLDFWHGDRFPCIEPSLKALLTYGFGWGSGYGSVSTTFSQYLDDSLIEVLNLTESEYVNFFDGRESSRSVKGKYKILSKSKIIINYIYELTGSPNNHSDRVFFRRRFTIPYYWEPEKKQFLPRFSKRFARLYGLHREYSENEFDGYFDKELNNMRNIGPIWRRHALGNHADE